MILTTVEAQNVDWLYRGNPAKEDSQIRYLCVATGMSETVEQVEKYMYGPSVVCELGDAGRMKFYLAIVDTYYAQQICDRLASGIMGAKAYPSWHLAYQRMLELV